MTNIKKLTKVDLISCLDLIELDRDEFINFKTIGWSNKQIEIQLNKSLNFSFGIYENNYLVSFMLGDLIYIEKDSEYEILLLYVKKSKRREGLASKLLYCLEKQKKYLNLQKIYLEVSKNNNKAIFFYKKNKFNLINIRNNYYLINNQKFDSLCYEKKL